MIKSKNVKGLTRRGADAVWGPWTRWAIPPSGFKGLSGKGAWEVLPGAVGVSLAGASLARLGARTGGATHISKGARGWGARYRKVARAAFRGTEGVRPCIPSFQLPRPSRQAV